MDRLIVQDKYSKDEPCEANPDVAGIGVVASYVFAAVLTTAASIAAAILDEILRAETSLLPKKLNMLFSRNQDPRRLRRCRIQRKILDRLILSLADQQLVAGFALLLTGWIVYHDATTGAHFALIVHMGSLSSSSHLAALISLRTYFRANEFLARLRGITVSFFFNLLVVSMTFSGTASLGPVHILLSLFGRISRSVGGFLSLVLLTLMYATALMELYRETLANVRWPRAIRKKLREMQLVNALLGALLSPAAMFITQILYAISSMVMVFLQKFGKGGRDAGEELCSLNSKEENEMGYGQILAVLLLVLPAFAAVEAYKGQVEPCAVRDYVADDSTEEQKAAHSEDARQGLRCLQRSSDQLRRRSSDDLLSLVTLNNTSQAQNDRESFESNFSSPRRQDTEARIGSLPGLSTTTAWQSTPGDLLVSRHNTL